MSIVYTWKTCKATFWELEGRQAGWLAGWGIERILFNFSQGNYGYILISCQNTTIQMNKHHSLCNKNG